jgi:Tfp pilus assembly protein PilN
VEAVGKALGCPAELFDPLSHLDAAGADRASREDAERAGLEAAAVLGLAFSAVVPTATRLDLLPLRTKARLEFRHRTLWVRLAAGALAASLLLSLGMAFVARSGQSARQSALKGAAAAVTQRVEGHKALGEQNDRRDQELRGLSERARPGFHLSSLLHMLGEATPPEVSLRSLQLERIEPQGAFRFQLEGVADNAQRKGVEAMRALEAALAADPRVASARVQPVETEGVTLSFKLTVVPAGNPSPEPPAEKGGS